MVPGAGIEPARLSAGDFESPASTNFTTRAVDIKPQIMAQGEALHNTHIPDAIFCAQGIFCIGPALFNSSISVHPNLSHLDDLRPLVDISFDDRTEGSWRAAL